MKVTLFFTNFVFAFLIFIGAVNAAAQVEIIKYVAGETDYLTYIFHSWDQGSNIPLDQNYCPVNSGCYVGVAWQVSDPSSIGSISQPRLSPNDTKGALTIGDLEKIWREKYGYGSAVRVSGYPVKRGKKICFGLKYSQSNLGVKVVPGSTCVDLIPGPPTNSCYMDGPINLDHGSISISDLSGSTTSQVVNIRCLVSSLVNISIITGNGGESIKLNSQGSLMSTVSVNGKVGPNGSVISVPGGAGGKNVEFKSTLKTNGVVSAGEHSGSATAVLNVM
ncbi:MrpH family fimbial adhesin [Serratia nevei]|uniref:MrpH family fimbial adhesin n=1 Tax=Serratia nevei TaxID=2703794 RepID=UPI003FA79507